jgi:anion-transporting  ArsA/GET3 family ATPase
MTSVESLLEGKRIVICAGSGGVGKTTTAAALGLGMAERGLRVAVVTIDPAKRLATSLGLEELGNEPRQVEPARLAAHGIEAEGDPARQPTSDGAGCRI